MGTYLMTGLKVKNQITCETEQESENIKRILAQHCGIKQYPEGIYDITWKDKYLVYQISETIMKNELIPFLEEFYEVYCPKQYRQEADKALNFLKNNPYEKWDNFFKEGSVYDCSFENVYDEIYTEEMSKNVKVILLRLAFEGKVMAEEMGLHLNLYTYALKKAFSYKIAEALYTNIEG